MTTTDRQRSAERKQFLSDILTTAIEAGYPWFLVEQYQYQEYESPEGHRASLYCGARQGDDTQAIVREMADDEASYKPERHTVTLDTIAHGLKLYIGHLEASLSEYKADLTDTGAERGHERLRRQVTHLSARLDSLKAADRDNDAGNLDAGEADNIMQMAVVGEIVYG